MTASASGASAAAQRWPSGPASAWASAASSSAQPQPYGRSEEPAGAADELRLRGQRHRAELVVQRGPGLRRGHRVAGHPKQPDQQPVHLHARVPVVTAVEHRGARPRPVREVTRRGHRVVHAGRELPPDVGQRHLRVAGRPGAQQVSPFLRQVHSVPALLAAARVRRPGYPGTGAPGWMPGTRLPYAYRSACPDTQVRAAPPTQTWPDGSAEMCTRPARPSTVPWLAT